jgi:hypothetical protein
MGHLQSIPQITNCFYSSPEVYMEADSHLVEVRWSVKDLEAAQRLLLEVDMIGARYVEHLISTVVLVDGDLVRGRYE